MAEVLITLVVIGIIAAITVPMIHANYKKQETVLKLKKTYSTLAQATRLAELENGNIYEFYSNSDKKAVTIFNTYFKPYLETSKLLTSEDKIYDKNQPFTFSNGQQMGVVPLSDSHVAFLLDDGIFIFVVIDYNEPRVYMDINAGNKPNRLGKDLFLMVINEKKGLIPRCTFASEKPCTITTANLECKTNGSACLAKILLDGWEIKKDYPHKI